ncbi:Choline transporter-like protein 1 [Tribolium castaneum]|uniref:Choline transporter-like protein n=1 Tax=Tribolium castaneum TaxID=7070 RepID=A0A139WKF3_TRICA|nr:PREDICTED: choline transporter-like protein 2 isoform X2 [Tribolium castaneum]KYB28528.1 Choline transporter-like protein 1 [Tribolium castaneum]|eukprot:XP_015833701.1 PREDICTED: choline transporter-like protein 2 isoform X2 [Tribolium castaneum]
MSNVPEELERSEDEPEYKNQPVEPIHVFRGEKRSARIALPQTAYKRKCTDVVVGIVFGIAFVSLIGSAVFIAISSDFRILMNGVDACGNVCGVKNTKQYNKTCPGKDYTKYPVLDAKEQECITADECRARNMTLFGGRCMPNQRRSSTKKKTFFSDRDYYKSIDNIIPYSVIVLILMPTVASGLSLVVYSLIRYHPKACYFWYLVYVNHRDKVEMRLKLVIIGNAVACTIGGLVLFLILACRSSRVPLLIEIYYETFDAICSSKLIFLAPVATMALICLLGISWLFMMFVTSAVKIPQDEGFPADRIVYLCFLVFMGYWIFTFVEGCQCIMIAGTMASYYFSSDRDEFEGEYCKNVGIVIRFHLGTVATGSLLITTAAMIRLVVDILSDWQEAANVWEVIRYLIFCILDCVGEVVYYISQKAYIMTAIHGKNFWVSGKRAAKLIWYNFLDTITVDGLNSAVRFSASVLILVVVLILGYAVLSTQPLGFIIENLFIGGILASAALYLFFSLLGTAVGTIFLCYCEDAIMNDGSDERPYFMSEDLEYTLYDALEEVAEKREEREERKEMDDEDDD